MRIHEDHTTTWQRREIWQSDPVAGQLVPRKETDIFAYNSSIKHTNGLAHTNPFLCAIACPIDDPDRASIAPTHRYTYRVSNIEVSNCVSFEATNRTSYSCPDAKSY